MNPLAHLLLAAAALHAAAAAAVPEAAPLPASILDSQPQLVPDTAPKEDAPALDNLRAKPEGIPVQVVIEEVQPAVTTNEVSDDVDEVQRFQIDLKNPGPPQRQEHETQNSDQFSDAQQKLTAVQDSFVQTQNLLRQGIKDVGDDITNWLSTNEQVTAIEQHIQSLRESFTAQIKKLTEAVQQLAAPRPSQPGEGSEQAQVQPDLKEVESSIKILESNFDNGVRALSEGVNIVAILRAEDESAASTPGQAPAASTPATSSPGQIVIQFVNSFQQTVLTQLENVRNVTSAVANNVANNVPGVASFFNRTTTLPPNVQADAPAETPQNPVSSFFSNILPTNFNIQNLFPNQNQNQGTTATTESQQPFLSQIQNFFFRPTSKPTEAVASASNVVPQTSSAQKEPAAAAAAAAAASADPPAPAPALAALAGTPQPVGPIKQIVQRIQSTMNNPEKPRDTEKPEDPQTKGGLFYNPVPVGHRPISSTQGDSDGSGLKSQEEPIKEIKDEIKKADDKEIPAEV